MLCTTPCSTFASPTNLPVCNPQKNVTQETLSMFVLHTVIVTHDHDVSVCLIHDVCYKQHRVSVCLTHGDCYTQSQCLRLFHTRCLLQTTMFMFVSLLNCTVGDMPKMPYMTPCPMFVSPTNFTVGNTQKCYTRHHVYFCPHNHNVSVGLIHNACYKRHFVNVCFTLKLHCCGPYAKKKRKK